MPLIDTQPDALAHIYAKSLFELAEGKGGRAAIEDILGELEDILELARSDARFGEFLSSRTIGTKPREESLRRIFKGRVNDVTLNFLLVLNAKGRLSKLPSIAAAYDQVVQERFGRVEVDVFTATPIGPDGIATLRERLGKAFSKEVIVHPYTENSMIGGIKLRIGDQLVDASVQTRLRKMKDKLDESGAAELRARIGRIMGE